MDFLSVAEAADRIGVSQRRVRNLAGDGSIALVARGVIEADSVSTFLRRRGTVQRRVWDEKTAWAAVSLLADTDASWLGASQASRLKKQIRTINSTELVSRVRNRATHHEFDGHRPVAGRVADELVRGSGSVGNSTIAQGIDGYLRGDLLDDLVSCFHLRASRGTISVRCTDHLDKVKTIADHDPDLLAAVDPATSADAREREAALTLSTTRISTL
ncbi:hypothetical protein ASD10_15435 [Aeromicrobium sp. Root472D3]|nr:hypothetical protein ASD10_15435 [Aeromicrobium sp. Root472D3]